MAQTEKFAPQGQWPGLIWGFDMDGGVATPIASDQPPPGAFRWLHVSLADARARRWLEGPWLPPLAREVLLSVEEHPRALVEDNGVIACVIQDWGREFGDDALETMRPLRFALLDNLMLTARQAPVKGADEIKRRLDKGEGPADACAALDLLLGVCLGEANTRLLGLLRQSHDMEDALLESDREPTTIAMQLLRRRAVQLLRQTGGVHSVLARLEDDEALPAPLLAPVERLVQRAAGLERDAAGLIAQERLLRDELGVRASSRANRNLYVLSIMTALMLPPTLVTGFFGMNTGGLPFAHGGHGTWVALVIGLIAAGGTYLYLRGMGFFSNGGA
ncbi:MAG: magnesium transporter CorA [Caulobacteraceae bacterium]|nr:magnesium transporter CorA [Caulobacteraceae bacterium]